MHLPSCAVPGEVLSSCGAGTIVLLHHAVWLFSSCSLLVHLYLLFEGLLSRSGVEPPLKMWCAKLPLSSCRVWVLLSTCGVQVGSSLVAMCVLLSSCGGGIHGSCIMGLGVPLEVRWVSTIVVVGWPSVLAMCSMVSV